MNKPPSPSPSPPEGPSRKPNLTPEQRDAVTYLGGSQAVLTGAGSGKTTLVAERVMYLLSTEDPNNPGQPLARPEEILVLTFTTSAAAECALRIQARLGADAINGMVIATFHSLCARILRQHAPAIGRAENFTIYDQREVRTVIDYILADKARKPVRVQLERFGACSAKVVQEEISLAKGRVWTPDYYEQESTHPIAPLIAAVWRELEVELRESNALDFESLLCCCVELFNQHPELLNAYRAKYRHILVDEVQDLNWAQAGLVVLLGAPAGDVTWVGDVNQRVFGWRGGELRNLDLFDERFPTHRTVPLGLNFRSKEEIVQAAAQLIEHNHRRPHIDYRSARGFGAVLDVHRFDNEWAEGAWVANEISQRLKQGWSADQILVIGRNGFVTKPVQRALAQANIKHRVIASLGLYERSEIKDALAYLWLLVNPDDPVALRRALAIPKRGAGPATIDSIVAYARANKLDLLTACTQVEHVARIKASVRAKIDLFGSGMLDVKREHAEGRSLGHVAAAGLMLEGGLVQHYTHQRRTAKRHDERQHADGVLEDLRSVCRAASSYEQQQGVLATLLGFLEHAVGLHSQQVGAQDPMATIGTIHRAKGMGKRAVFICGCERRVLPSWQAIELGTIEAMEEERCLMFVAITRGEDEVHFTWCLHRNGHPTDGLSPFVVEAGVL